MDPNQTPQYAAGNVGGGGAGAGGRGNNIGLILSHLLTSLTSNYIRIVNAHFRNVDIFCKSFIWLFSKHVTQQGESSSGTTATVLGSRWSAHGCLGICRQEIVVVNEIVLQYTNNLFS